MKKCTKCKEEKHPRAFYKDNRNKDKLNYKCKTCMKEQASKWYSTNKEKMTEVMRKTHLRKYGLTEESYERMLENQGGVCAICKGGDRRRLSVDHCHKTGQVRGLLCRKCNSTLGFFNDDTKILRTAIGYLEHGV